MKKFFIFLIIVVILGGTAFFFGWAQLPVPPGAYGVLQSKTNGVDPVLIQSGKVRWVWYKLIPTNAKTYVFRIKPVTGSLNAEGNLASSDVYAKIAGVQSDFSYTIDGSFNFTLKPACLVALVKEKGITNQAGLDAYTGVLAQNIRNFAVEHMQSYGGNSDIMAKPLETGLVPKLETDIKQTFPDIDAITCTITKAKIPDFALYNSIRAVYDKYLASQKSSLETDLSSQAAQKVKTQIHFDELEKYGELLTKYPILLDYLKLRQDKPGVPGEQAKSKK